MSKIEKILIPQARFPREELKILSRLAIERRLPQGQDSHKVSQPIVNFGYLYLKRACANTPDAIGFWHRECDCRDYPKETLEFPKEELKLISKLNCPDLVEPILFFALNSLERFDKQAANNFLQDLDPNTKTRLAHLKSISNRDSNLRVSLKEKIDNHLNHLCNLRHILSEEDIKWHYKSLDRYLETLNEKTPGISDTEGLRELHRRISSPEFKIKIFDISQNDRLDEPVKFW